MEYLQNGQIEPSIIGKEYFISLTLILDHPAGPSVRWARPNGKWIKYIEHHKRKTEAKDKPDSKDENEKTAQEKTEITETVTVTDTSGKDLEVKKKPEREFEEPKDETAKDEAA